MKVGVVTCGAAALLSFVGVQIASATILYNPVVSQVGDGTAVVSGQGRTTTISIYQNTTPNQLAPASSLAFPSAANSPRLINSDSASSEANLSNNPAISDKAAKGLPYSGNAYTYSSGYDAAN